MATVIERVIDSALVAVCEACTGDYWPAAVADSAVLAGTCPECGAPLVLADEDGAKA